VSALVVLSFAIHIRASLALAHLRRGNRVGFTAGALAHGLRRTRGELIAIWEHCWRNPKCSTRRRQPCMITVLKRLSLGQTGGAV
jgi:hypothetical protein